VGLPGVTPTPLDGTLSASLDDPIQGTEDVPHGDPYDTPALNAYPFKLLQKIQALNGSISEVLTAGKDSLQASKLDEAITEPLRKQFFASIQACIFTLIPMVQVLHEFDLDKTTVPFAQQIFRNIDNKLDAVPGCLLLAGQTLSDEIFRYQEQDQSKALTVVQVSQRIASLLAHITDLTTHEGEIDENVRSRTTKPIYDTYHQAIQSKLAELAVVKDALEQLNPSDTNIQITHLAVQLHQLNVDRIDAEMKQLYDNTNQYNRAGSVSDENDYLKRAIPDPAIPEVKATEPSGIDDVDADMAKLEGIVRDSTVFDDNFFHLLDTTMSHVREFNRTYMAVEDDEDRRKYVNVTRSFKALLDVIKGRLGKYSPYVIDRYLAESGFILTQMYTNNALLEHVDLEQHRDRWDKLRQFCLDGWEDRLTMEDKILKFIHLSSKEKGEWFTEALSHLDDELPFIKVENGRDVVGYCSKEDILRFNNPTQLFQLACSYVRYTIQFPQDDGDDDAAGGVAAGDDADGGVAGADGGDDDGDGVAGDHGAGGDDDGGGVSKDTIRKTFLKSIVITENENIRSMIEAMTKLIYEMMKKKPDIPDIPVIISCIKIIIANASNMVKDVDLILLEDYIYILEKAIIVIGKLPEYNPPVELIQVDIIKLKRAVRLLTAFKALLLS
jgi:hypothetical protein